MGRDPRVEAAGGTGSFRRVRVSYPRCNEPQERATARPVAVRGGLPLPALPRPRPAYAGRLHARPGLRRRPDPAARARRPGSVLRMDRIELLGLRPQPVRPRRRSSSSTSSSCSTGWSRSSTPTGSPSTSTATRPAATAGSGPARLPRNPLSIAGLLAVVLVMAGSHVVVARYDLLALDVLDSGCIFIGDDRARSARPRRLAVARRDGDAEPDPTAEPTDIARPRSRPPVGSAGARGLDPAVGRQGAAQHPAHRRRPAPRTAAYNTDTLIVVSIDPVTKQVAMFSLPRDTVDVPIPPGPARSVCGPRLPRQDQRLVYVNIRNRSDLWPGNEADARLQRASRRSSANCTASTSSTSSRSTSTGFRKVVDAIGGVTINVQVPVSTTASRRSTGRLAGSTSRAGSSTWTAPRRSATPARATRSTDFDRGARQQRVLLSLREQADPQDADPAAARARRRAQEGRPDRHPGRPARRAARAGLGGRHEEHPLVRVRAAALPAGVPARARAATSSFPNVAAHPGRGQERVHGRPGRRGPAPERWPRRAPACGSSTAPATASRGPDARRLPRVPRAGRVGAAPEAAGRRPGEHEDRRLQRRRGRELPDTIAYLEKMFKVTVDDGGRPGDPRPTSSSRSARTRRSSRRPPP